MQVQILLGGYWVQDEINCSEGVTQRKTLAQSLRGIIKNEKTKSKDKH